MICYLSIGVFGMVYDALNYFRYITSFPRYYWFIYPDNIESDVMFAYQTKLSAMEGGSSFAGSDWIP